MQKNKYEVRVDHVAIFIDRRNGERLECLIDIEDLNLFLSLPGKVHANWSKPCQTFYVRYYGPRKDDKQVQLMFHRTIMSTPDHLEVDHLNHNGLDNRKLNLKNATPTQNQLNKKLKGQSLSGVHGVRQARNGQWRADMQHKGRRIHFGTFATVKQASRAVKNYRDSQLKEYLHGE